MSTATLPLNRDAAKAANAAVAGDTGGRPLTTGPQDAAARDKWMKAYEAAGGQTTTNKAPTTHTTPTSKLSATKTVAAPVQSCPLKDAKKPTKKVVCAGPYAMTDPEKEGPRKANEAMEIEIVPESTVGGDVVYVKHEGSCSCAGAKVDVAGTKHALGTPIKVNGWSVGANDPFRLATMLGGVEPKESPMQLICGMTQNAIGSGKIRVYPSDKVTIQIDTEKLFERCERVKDAFDKLMKVVAKYIGKEYDPEEGINFNTSVGRVKIDKPKLTGKYEAQWKEYKEGEEQWKAYYGWELSLGLGIGVSLKVDVLGCAASATGVGAPVVALAKKVQNYIGQEDPIFFLGLTFDMSANGIVGYEEKLKGGIKGEGAGTINLGAGVNIPHKIEAYIVGSTGLSGKLEGTGSKSGPEIKVEALKWEGVKGVAHVKLDTKFFSIGYESTVQLLDPAGPLWEHTFKL